MKNNSFFKLFIIILMFISINVNGQFTNGNLVVLKVGDGVSTLANTGNAAFFIEYSTTGSLVNTIAVPTTGTDPACVSGSASSEGQITRSPDGTLVSFAGYKITPPYTSSLANSTSATVNRVVVSVNPAGVVSTVATTSTQFSGNNIRSAVSDGNNNYWAAGGNTGVYHFGSTASDTAVVSTTSTNIRYIAIFNSQLYYVTAKGTYGLYKVGTGTPTTTGQTSTNIIATGSTSSPYAFSINATSDTCYIAIDSATTAGGGVQKWINNSGTWTLAYTLGIGGTSLAGCRSLTVKWGGTYPIIYATTAEATENRLIKIIDNGLTAAAVTLATAPTNTLFRGVAFAPANNTVVSAPSVNTMSKSGVTSNSAICYGNLVSENNSTVTAMGICYGLTANPDTNSTHTTIAGALGTFSSNLSSLTGGNTYHYRAYAKNAIGVSYGADSIFTTPTASVTPVVTTTNYSNLGSFSVSITGNVVSDGGSVITARGICWSTASNPSILNTHSTESGTTGTFTSNLTGLTQGTTYYAKAYATNSIGTSYGVEISFTTPYYIPNYTISQVKSINAQGVSDSINVYCSLTGIVHGLNYTNVGLSFYMIDATAGINIYSASSTYGYTVTEGDKIRVIGKIQQTRGLIEILPDSIVKISAGNTLYTAQTVTTLNEANESMLVRMNGLTYISGWPTIAGPTATVLASNGTDNITIVIYSQCPLQGTPAPTAPFNVTGIESQYTTSITPPFLSDYMILPRSASDLITSINTISGEESGISIYPNPSNGKFNINTNIKNAIDIKIYTLEGSLIYHNLISKPNSAIDISKYSKGIYILNITNTKTNTVNTSKLIIE